MVAVKRILNRIFTKFRHRSAGCSPTVRLLLALTDSESFLAVNPRLRAQHSINKPQRLPQKRKQQQSGKKLRTSKAFAREIWAHKVEPSVLPCRRLLRGKFCNE